MYRRFVLGSKNYKIVYNVTYLQNGLKHLIESSGEKYVRISTKSDESND